MTAHRSSAGADFVFAGTQCERPVKRKGQMSEVVRSAGSGAPDVDRWARSLVKTVARVYWEVRTGERRWKPQLADLVVDVERAVTQTLAGRADGKTLIQEWNRLVEDRSDAGEREATLIALLAPVFSKRGLHPSEYLRPFRQ